MSNFDEVMSSNCIIFIVIYSNLFEKSDCIIRVLKVTYQLFNAHARRTNTLLDNLNSRIYYKSILCY